MKILRKKLLLENWDEKFTLFSLIFVYLSFNNQTPLHVPLTKYTDRRPPNSPQTKRSLPNAMFGCEKKKKKKEKNIKRKINERKELFLHIIFPYYIFPLIFLTAKIG